MPAYAQRSVPVNVLVPTFQTPKGKSEIGVKTASILGLQIWRTYSRRAKEHAFDDANIVENSKSRPATYLEVEALAKRQSHRPHLVLWGKASEYGHGIIVESNLLIRANIDKHKFGTNIWTVTFRLGKSVQEISVDVPTNQYEFAPIVLDPALVSKISENTLWRSGTSVYQLKSTGAAVVGNLRNASAQAISHEEDWSFVRLQNPNRSGWVYLPNLSRNPSEVVIFCSGIIRMFRHDWSGAIELFEQVLKTAGAPTNIKIDSHLYMSLAYEKMNKPDRSYSMVAEAYQLNPYSKTTTKYLCMVYLSQLEELLMRRASEQEIQATIESLKDVISKNKILFSEDDPWIFRLEETLEKLEARVIHAELPRVLMDQFDPSSQDLAQTTVNPQ